MDLDRRTNLEGLAEEAAELAQAALKLIRAERLSENVTPVSKEDAAESLMEELVDVLMVASVLGINLDELLWRVSISHKWKRWEDRLNRGKGEKTTDEQA